MYIPFVVMFLYSLINQMLLIEAKDKDNVSFGFISYFSIYWYIIFV